MTLTAKDFEITQCTCPMCRRPATIYSRGGCNYLRCMWEDCSINKGMLPVSAERFFEIVERFERDGK